MRAVLCEANSSVFLQVPVGDSGTPGLPAMQQRALPLPAGPGPEAEPLRPLSSVAARRRLTAHP